MGKTYSPLRYPGGKVKLVPFFKKLLQENHLIGTTYVEPFAGGANVALSLLIDGYVSKIIINDVDKSIYAFWYSILKNTDEFIKKIQHFRISITEWKRQKSILENPQKYSELELGFAAFFLNRTNFSGVLQAGPIGGLQQKGTYKINARFNKKLLIEKIRLIASYKHSILVTCKDALDVINFIRKIPKCLVYFDPPYYVQGKKLYTNFYQHSDHAKLAASIQKLTIPLVITYDNVEQIKALYNNLETKEFIIHYSAKRHTTASEVMFLNNIPYNSRYFLKELVMPNQL